MLSVQDIVEFDFKNRCNCLGAMIIEIVRGV